MTQPPPDPTAPNGPPTSPAAPDPVTAYQPPADPVAEPRSPYARPLGSENEPPQGSPPPSPAQPPAGAEPEQAATWGPQSAGAQPTSAQPVPGTPWIVQPDPSAPWVAQPGPGTPWAAGGQPDPSRPWNAQGAGPYPPGYPQPGAYPPPGYPQPPAGGGAYPPPGYPGAYYPGYQPATPPKPRNNKLLIGLGAGLLAVVLICVGAGIFLIHRAATNVDNAAGREYGTGGNGYPGSQGGVPDPLSSLNAQQLKAVGSDGKPLAVGQTLTAQDGVGDKVRLTITKIHSQKKSCYDFDQLPAGKSLLIADLTVQVDAGSLRPSEFDFTLTSDTGRPASAFEGILSGCGKSLSPSTQRAGSIQKANLIFITDVKQGEIVYSPALGPEPIGSWTVG